MRIPIGTIASSISQGVKLWFSRFSSSLNEEYLDIAIDTEGNGTSLAVGYRNVSGSLYGVIVMYDKDGTVLWKKERTNSNVVRFSGAAYTPAVAAQGTTAKWYVCGRDEQNAELYLVQLDMSGNVVWERTISDVGQRSEIVTNDTVGYPKICSNNLDTVYVAYNTHFNQHIGITRYSSTGNRVWSKTYNYDSNGYNLSAYNVAYQTYLDQIVIVGSVFTGAPYRSGFIALFTPDGLHQRFARFTMSGIQRHTVFTGIYADPSSGDYAFTGWYDSNNTSDRTAIFGKFNLLNQSYTPYYAKTFKYNSYYTSANSVYFDNSYIYVSGTVSPDGSTPKKQLITKFSNNSSTELITNRIINSYFASGVSGPETTRTYKILADNNSIYTAGFMRPSGSTDLLIAKLDKTLNKEQIFDNTMDGSREGNIAFSFYNMGSSYGNISWTNTDSSPSLSTAIKNSSFGFGTSTYTTMSSSLEYGLALFS